MMRFQASVRFDAVAVAYVELYCRAYADSRPGSASRSCRSTEMQR